MFQKALIYKQQSYEIQEKVLEKNSVELSITLNTLGILHGELKLYDIEI